MGASVVLYRGIEKTVSNIEEGFEEKKNKIGDLFIKSGFMVPDDLLEDLFQFYIDRGDLQDLNDDSLRNFAYHLVDVIDLFSMDYDLAKDSLELDEWVTLRNLFSTYSDDIDDDLLTYVMQLAIEKGAFR
ncbi:MAG: hypothetical protein L3J12_10410 [Spirochaetales bacterium]|nr:hypothetical protein [Spirochaetales bacterium]